MTPNSSPPVVFDEVLALRGTRHLVLEELHRRIEAVEARSELCDAECDRALAEAWRMLKWIDGRMKRNEAGQGVDSSLLG
ncbi:MAG: hypothetical protein KGQ66_16945 [Acidobacteriota bacterium]|nr:hypothetical protein [Acidobacteriota bacterium]